MVLPPKRSRHTRPIPPRGALISPRRRSVERCLWTEPANEESRRPALKKRASIWGWFTRFTQDLLESPARARSAAGPTFRSIANRHVRRIRRRRLAPDNFKRQKASLFQRRGAIHGDGTVG